VESSTSCWNSGLPSSRKPRIDANASSSGKIEKKAQYAMSVARRDAPSSVNFFATAHGTAVSGLACCQRSIASLTGCALIARASCAGRPASRESTVVRPRDDHPVGVRCRDGAVRTVALMATTERASGRGS